MRFLESMKSKILLPWQRLEKNFMEVVEYHLYCQLFINIRVSPNENHSRLIDDSSLNFNNKNQVTKSPDICRKITLNKENSLFTKQHGQGCQLIIYRIFSK